VALANVTFTQQASALSNGTVDAIITFQPFLSQAENLLDDKAVMWPAQASQPDCNEVICTKEWAPAHSSLIERFLEALVQAETFIINNKDQAMSIIAKDLNYTNTYARAYVKTVN